MNKLPTPGDSSLDLDSITLLKELDNNGQLARYFANTVLGEMSKEAWSDALLAIGMEEVQFSEEGRLIMNLQALLQYILTVMHDVNLLGRVPKSEIIPPDGGHFLFGWWHNCPRSSSGCLLPDLPEDMIFSLSQNVRIYISPSLELSLIVTSADASPDTAKGEFTAKKVMKTIGEILRADGLIWAELESVVSGEGSSQSSRVGDGASKRQQEEEKDDRKKEKSETSTAEFSKASEQGRVEDPDRTDSQLAAWIHWGWPVTIFFFWVTISHVWVYWVFHCAWFILTRLSNRAHVPRPKTARDTAGRD